MIRFTGQTFLKWQCASKHFYRYFTPINTFIFIIVFFVIVQPVDASTQLSSITILAQSAAKRVLVPHENYRESWRTDINFDDSSWEVCNGSPGGIGYERGSGYENLITLDVGDDMHQDGGDPNPSCLIRIPFSVNKAVLADYVHLQLKMRYDDGFVAWLNGIKVAESNAPSSPTWNSFATVNHEASGFESFNISNFKEQIRDGDNLLAIQGLNVELNSSDFLIMTELIANDNLFGDFTTSNLPLVLIDTQNQTIINEPKIDARMQIINNANGINRPTDAATDYDGRIGIEIRGHHSSGFPQRPYGLETRDELGENFNVPLLGMPAENDWILLSNYNEKSFARSSLGLDLFRRMGYYSPRALLCEVFLNYEYRGVYVFTEKIKQDKNRVNIADLLPEENTGDDVTGGYIIKVDYHNSSDSWLSPFRPLGHPDKRVYFVYNYPKADEITDEQKQYIQNHFEKIEGALYSDHFADPETGYRQYMDVPSFIDYFIVSEVSRNVDGYKKSRYFYKDKDSKGGLLHAGPVWDFDWAWKNIPGCTSPDLSGSGWYYKTNDCNPDNNCPGWYVRLFQDAYFTHKLIERYFELRQNILHLDTINAYIDSVAAHVDVAKDRHFTLWPIEQDYRTPEIDGVSYSYEQEITKLKNLIRIRIGWLDENIPKLEDEILTQVAALRQSKHNITDYKIYPNPATNYLYIQAIDPIQEIRIYNIVGQQVLYKALNHSSMNKIQINHLPPGLYFIRSVYQDKTSVIHKHIFTTVIK